MPFDDQSRQRVDSPATPLTGFRFRNYAHRGDVVVIDTSTTAAVLDLRTVDMSDKWIRLQTTGADLGFFFRLDPRARGASTALPDLAARVGSNPDQQCALLADGETTDRFFVDPRHPILAYVGSGPGVLRVLLQQF